MPSDIKEKADINTLEVMQAKKMQWFLVNIES